MKRFTFLTLSFSFMLMACSPNISPSPNMPDSQNTDPTSEGYTLYVHSKTRECVGVGPQTCMQVRKSPDGEWQLFYDQIEGFDYEAGYEYALQVSETEIENPPADASSLRISLIKVLSKTAVETAENKLANTHWTYSGRQINDAFTPALEGSQVTLKFTEDQTSGNAGCNLFSGGYSLDETSLSFDMLAITERACLDQELQQQEQAFIQALSEVSQWRIEEQQLFLKYAEEAELVFQAAENL